MTGNIKRIAVVGGGVMGNGIAQVAAQAGFDVTVVDTDEERLERAIANVSKSLGRLVKAEKLTQEQADQTLARLRTTTDLEAAGAEAEHVIEAVPEKIELKQEIFRRLDAVCAESVIFATNTSQFSITAIAAVTNRRDRVIGTHWFNPPPVMRLIEVVRGLETSVDTVAATLALAEAYGKETIVVQRDAQGFVTSRMILMLTLEAMRIAEEGLASVEDINKACVLAFNHAMGPLDTADLGGLDTCLNSALSMTEHYGDRFLAPQNVRTLVAGGHLGRKTGRGFRAYGEKQRN